ncbi:helix-turn-helix domain-containing protein [Pseudomonas sp. X10]
MARPRSYATQETLESCQGNLDEAARRLGISQTTLWRQLRSAR